MFAMPAIMLLYLYSSLDRGNLGNLRLLGLVGPRGYSPDPTGKKYGLLVSVFFIGYAVLGMSGVCFDTTARSSLGSHPFRCACEKSRPTTLAGRHRRATLGCSCYRVGRYQHLGPRYWCAICLVRR